MNKLNNIIIASKIMQTLNDSTVPADEIKLERSPLASRSPFFIGTMNLSNKERRSNIYIEKYERFIS